MERSQNQAFLNLSAVAANSHSSSGKAFASSATEGISASLSEALAFCSLEGNNFSNYVRLLIPSESQEGISEKSAVKDGLAPNARMPFIHLRSVTFLKKINRLARNHLPFAGELLFLKHHGLANNFAVWHVMCRDIPISCTERTVEPPERFSTCPSCQLCRGTAKRATDVYSGDSPWNLLWPAFVSRGVFRRE